jgi:hypothetical protein
MAGHVFSCYSPECFHVVFRRFEHQSNEHFLNLFEVIDQHMQVNAIILSHPKAMFHPSPPQKKTWKRSIGTSLFVTILPMS